jgi:hypothetical protein
MAYVPMSHPLLVAMVSGHTLVVAQMHKVVNV